MGPGQLPGPWSIFISELPACTTHQSYCANGGSADSRALLSLLYPATGAAAAAAAAAAAGVVAGAHLEVNVFVHIAVLTQIA